jgi:hypothetical protein
MPICHCGVAEGETSIETGSTSRTSLGMRERSPDDVVSDGFGAGAAANATGKRGRKAQ